MFIYTNTHILYIHVYVYVYVCLFVYLFLAKIKGGVQLRDRMLMRHVKGPVLLTSQAVGGSTLGVEQNSLALPPHRVSLGQGCPPLLHFLLGHHHCEQGMKRSSRCRSNCRYYKLDFFHSHSHGF